MKKQTHPRWRKRPPINIYKLLSIILIIIFIIFAPSLIKKSIFVSKIICVSQMGDCPSVIMENIQAIKERNYLDLKNNTTLALRSDRLVADFLVQYQIPATLKIDLVTKLPRYAVQNNETFYLLDSKGTVLRTESKSDLPQIQITGLTLHPGDIVDDKILSLLLLTEKINVLYTVDSAVFKDGQVLEIKLNDGPIVIIPYTTDTDKYAGAIRLIYSRLNEDREGFRMNEVKEIDLRYKNPIIRKF